MQGSPSPATASNGAPSGQSDGGGEGNLHEHMAAVLQQVADRKRMEVQRQINSALCRSAEQRRALAQEGAAKVAAEQDELKARVAAAMQRRRDGGTHDAFQLATTLAARGRGGDPLYALGEDVGAPVETDMAQAPFDAMDASLYAQNSAVAEEMGSFSMADWDNSAEAEAAGRPGGSVPIEISRLLPGFADEQAMRDAAWQATGQDWRCWTPRGEHGAAGESIDWCSQDWAAWHEAATGSTSAHLPLDVLQDQAQLAAQLEAGARLLESALTQGGGTSSQSPTRWDAEPPRERRSRPLAPEECPVTTPPLQPAGEPTASTASHDAASDSGSDLLAECWQDRNDMLSMHMI